MNECADTMSNKCHPNANCVDEEGSYSCECQDGFNGDGWAKCQGKGREFIWENREPLPSCFYTCRCECLGLNGDDLVKCHSKNREFVWKNKNS